MKYKKLSTVGNLKGENMKCICTVETELKPIDERCKELTEATKKKLYDISNQFNIDINSLYLIFETHFSQMKDNIKKEYNSTN